MSLWNLASPDGHEIIRDRAQKRLRGEILGTDRQAYGFLHKGGSILWVEISGHPVTYRGEQLLQGTVRNTEGIRHRRTPHEVCSSSGKS